MDNKLFGVFLDESCDVSIKEQVAIALCYVDKICCIVEHFFGIVNVGETTALKLKFAIEALNSKHGLSIS